MMLNKEKLILQKKKKENKINNIKNKQGEEYLKSTLKKENEKYDIKKNPKQNKNKNENKNINISDEFKKKDLKQHKKAKINNYLDKFKTMTNLEKYTKSFKESENGQNLKIDLLENSNLKENEISNEKSKLNNKYLTTYSNKLYNNVNKNIVNNENKNNNNKIEYSKIIYNGGNKNRTNKNKERYSIELKDITKINYNQTIENYHLSRKKKDNNKYNSINFLRRNINELEIDKYNKINKNQKIHKPFYSIKKSLFTLDDDNIFENKTVNSFYTKKKHSTNSIIEDRNILYKQNSNMISELNEPQNNFNHDNNIDYLNLYNYSTLDNYYKKVNNTRNNKQVNRRKKNRIKITNNGAIKEFNISFNEDDNILGKNDLTKIYINNNKHNLMSLRARRNRKNSIFEEYNKYYIKTLPPININQFNINATNTNNSIQNLTENNTAQAYDNNYNSTFYEDFWTQGNTYNNLYNNIIMSNNAYNNTENNKIKNDKINDNKKRKNNSITIESNIRTNKILVKKRPIYEIKSKNHSYKKFNKLIFIQDKEKDYTNLSNKNYKNNKLELKPAKQIYFSVSSKLAKNKNSEVAIFEKKN